MYDQLSTTVNNPFVLALPIPMHSTSTRVNVSCSNHTDPLVSGASLLPRSCRLDSRPITIRASHRFLFAYTPSSKALSPFMNDRLLPSFNDQLDPFEFISSSHVTYGLPVMSTNFGIAPVLLWLWLTQTVSYQSLNSHVYSYHTILSCSFTLLCIFYYFFASAILPLLCTRI